MKTQFHILTTQFASFLKYFYHYPCMEDHFLS